MVKVFQIEQKFTCISNEQNDFNPKLAIGEYIKQLVISFVLFNNSTVRLKMSVRVSTFSTLIYKVVKQGITMTML